ncbi:universal stress protein [bacterium]|nr:universal stress protein [bacterium]
MENQVVIKKILIPIDFSETSLLALDHATHLAKIEGSKVVLIHVLKSGSYSNILPSLTSGGEGVELRDEISSRMNQIGSKFKADTGVDYEIVLAEGNVASQVVDTANELDIDLIMMGTHGVSGFQEFFMGSNAYRVVTAAMCPVLTVQSNTKELGAKRILLPLDSSPHTRDKVRYAVAMAKAFDSEILIRALITPNHEEEKNIFNLKVQQTEELFASQGIKYSSDFIYGDDIAEMTLAEAKKENIDLIIIMTEQEASTGLFMGQYAQRIVNHSRIPVLAITPLGIVQSFSQRNLGGDYRPFGV